MNKVKKGPGYKPEPFAYEEESRKPFLNSACR